jgi:hypothetical protein
MNGIAASTRRRRPGARGARHLLLGRSTASMIARAARERLALGGQLQAAGGAGQQGGAELVFQPPQRAADAGGVCPSCSAAAVIEPLSITARKACISSRVVFMPPLLTVRQE